MGWIIRRILVDHARNRGYAKRGGNAVRVPLDDVLARARDRGIEILALDKALESLSKIDGRKCRVVEFALFRRIECWGNRRGPGNLARDGQA
jgi:RNA polymerase sigma-70 factor (ECF subfamily)